MKAVSDAPRPLYVSIDSGIGLYHVALQIRFAN